jgi:uncharacterized membrane protein YdjX (TVP38/TMEM64 family)
MRIVRTLKKRWRWLAGLVLLAALWLIGRKLPIIEWLDDVAEPLRNMGWLGVLIYALCYAAAAMLCIPCMPLTLAGGYIFGMVTGTIAVHSGCVVAAAAGFIIGRLAGRKRAAEWLRKSERFHYLDDAVAHEGWKIVGLLRLQAIPFGISNYLYGMTKIDFWHYLLATAVAMLPGHFIYTHIGAVGGRHLAGRGDIGPVELIAPALAIASMITVTLLLTRMARKHGGLPRTGVP